jgi:hypothetical protein
MVSRRNFVFGPAIASYSRHSAAMDYEQISDRSVQDLTTAIREISGAIRQQRSFDEILSVRQKQLDFLHAQGKFPDFIEVGSDVWLAVYDWHVRHQQPITSGRDAAGRYIITLLTTTVILRSDTTQNYIGTPYDNR